MNGSRSKQGKRALLVAFLGLARAFPAAGATTWFVDGAATASADGLTWATAMKTIQEAVDATVIGDQIWVAEGLYSEHVTLKSGTSVYGGFCKTETTVDDRNLSVHRTILDGTGRTEPEILILEDSMGTVLDGIDVRNAAGMGVYVNNAPVADGANVSIRNCRFTGSVGAAVQIHCVSCAVENCYFGNNGGNAALEAEYGYIRRTYSIRKSVFENNAGRGLRVYGASYVDGYDLGDVIYEYRGYFDDATISVDQCATVGNGRGFSVQASKVSIVNCLIAENAGETWGGISCMGGSSASPMFIGNCTIVDNAGSGSGGDVGGGIYSRGGLHTEFWWYKMEGKWYWHYYYFPSYLNVTNCILDANDPNGIYLDIDYGSGLTPKNNLFHANAHAVQTDDDDYDTAAEVNSSFAGAAENADGDPAFADPAAGDYHLLRNSYAIDRGTAVSLTVDLDGAPRPVDAIGTGGGGTFDIGAYEYQGPTVYSPVWGQACYGQMPIRWVASDVAGAEVGISVWRNEMWLREIATLTANDGEFPWPIPAELEPARGYRVCVASTEGSGTLHFSEPFSIGKPPELTGAWDAGGGKIGLTWIDDNETTPPWYLSFAYDWYTNRFVSGGWGGTMWFPFLFPARSGQVNVVHSGFYHVWISNQWTYGAWAPCLNPRTLIMYSGRPHCPVGAWTEDRGGGVWRLHWAPEVYGTWLVQILVYQDGVGWIAPLDGPSSAFPELGPWTFVDYGGQLYDSAKGSFFEGWGDFALPPGAPLTFYFDFRAWDGQTQGPFAAVGAN